MTTRLEDHVLPQLSVDAHRGDTDAIGEILDEMQRARSEEARLLEVVKAKDERIKALCEAWIAVMGALTTFNARDVTIVMRRETYKKVLDAKVSP